MGRLLQVFLACFGVLLGVVIVGATLAALAISDHRSSRHQAPALAVAHPAVAERPGATPRPTAVAVVAPADPVQQAQAQIDGLVTQFALSLDVTERRRLLLQIRRLAATPGVTVPNH